MSYLKNDNKNLKQFNKVYKKYKTVINFLIITKVSNKSLHEDIFQDVMLKIYKQICEPDCLITNYKKLIYSITNNTIKDYDRKSKLLDVVNVELDKIIDKSFGSKTIIRDFVSELNDLERDLFVCYYVLNMNKKNISKELNISYTTCKRMLFEITIKLKTYYKQK